MIERPSISFVVPAHNGAKHITRTVDAIVNVRQRWAAVEIVLVDDFSSDQTHEKVVRQLASQTTITAKIIALSHNVGQIAATSIGMALATADYVVTIDDDLSHHPEEAEKLLSEFTPEIDFVVGAPHKYSNSTPREFLSKVARWLAIRSLNSPRDFIFSSFVMYRREFLNQIDFRREQTDKVGWVYGLSSRYKNATFEARPSIRNSSTYGVRDLYRVIRPLLLFTTSIWTRALQILAFLLSVVAGVMALTYLVRSLASGDFLPGFPTLAVALMVNIALSAAVLSTVMTIKISIAGSRQTDVLSHVRTVSSLPR